MIEGEGCVFVLCGREEAIRLSSSSFIGEVLCHVRSVNARVRVMWLQGYTFFRGVLTKRLVGCFVG